MQTREQQQIEERGNKIMKYRTKVTVTTQGKVFKPGSILPDDLSKSDLAFLKSKKFVEPADVPAAAYEDPEEDPEDYQEPETGGFTGFDVAEPDGMKSPDEIRKIRSKKEVAAYAKKIGLDLGEDYEEKSLKDLQAMTIDFQEEQMEGGADAEGE